MIKLSSHGKANTLRTSVASQQTLTHLVKIFSERQSHQVRWCCCCSLQSSPSLSNIYCRRVNILRLLLMLSGSPGVSMNAVKIIPLIPYTVVSHSHFLHVQYILVSASPVKGLIITEVILYCRFCRQYLYPSFIFYLCMGLCSQESTKNCRKVFPKTRQW